MNNRIYGMTGGQYSPLSGYGISATTAPYGNIDQGFDVVELARAAGATFVGRTTTYHVQQASEMLQEAIQHKGFGATFVARTTTYHVQQAAEMLQEAILHKGFSVVEIMSQCPTYFGRKNKEGGAVEMMKRMKENTTPVGSKAKEAHPELIERGVFVRKDLPEYCSEYSHVIERAQAAGTGKGR